MVEHVPGESGVEVERLRAENAALRQQLSDAAKQRRAAQEAKGAAIKTGGKLLLPLFDRYKVVRSGLDLFDVATRFSKPKEQWPSQDEVLNKGREFAMSGLRFVVRRRLFMLGLSMLAFLVPVVQVWLVFQQNAIIENQDKYFNIQVYDIVARSLTGEHATAKQITAALLAREDFNLVNGIISAVFESETGGAFTESDAAGGRPVLLEETAARGHLISALVLGLDRHGKSMSEDDLWQQFAPTFSLVVKDAATRLPQLLRLGRKTAFQDPAVGQECFRYLFSLSSVMRRAYSLSRAVDEEEAYFKSISTVIARLSRSPKAEGAFEAVFVSAMHELLVDLALEPEFGQGAPDVSTKEVGPLMKTGLNKLVEATRPHAQHLDAAGLARRLGVSL